MVWADQLNEDPLARVRALGLLDGRTVHGVHFGYCPDGDRVLVPVLATWHEERSP